MDLGSGEAHPRSEHGFQQANLEKIREFLAARDDLAVGIGGPANPQITVGGAVQIDL